ncbi:Deacetylates O-acetyl-ADP ribose. Down-regulates ribonuclease 3 (RNase III) activity. Acts by interacting directly with the region of the ribonuclease [Seminavis robusta]|uniref:Deacetylates O-acetyl-ADP ribose. Down-regulates ribonuclease 3 (RNase III) activity. Acts by interacting directly with the region of the ribonuclease n=1 Tax=Seminavis robusta TaxID=568900 RepID=A0A9N8DTB0_9STRA|nr:Deacetylates O-acetyl-ADP ribose. Down-regulates ribonuclease 3 (RNase III) activity. Acts by interacting directly with the region of the ribonuclease [Seminavis robusta]|eukprot:Sro355_g125040.1 Deacetylates O-acetyl-ADP ribose. Down-regulates ribonuclease 3 (RNase III) activity. Acts by interacting directly with the region of the ribonuclease (276) ;mRNA; r:25853-26680
MSRAWYLPGVVPKLWGSFVSSGGKRQVQVWKTPCAVTKAGKEASNPMACTALINPANPQLSGVSKFPYFPRGGPVPKEYPKKDSHHIMGYVTQWGGMEVGDGMLFAANVVDGMVHQLGGWRLAVECRLLPIVGSNPDTNEEERCPVGQAIVTGPGGADLQKHFDYVVHTVPPFYRHHPEPEQHLMQCYRNSLRLAFERASKVACPLLGAGARGFPLDLALEIAGQASLEWRDHSSDHKEKQSLSFAIPDPEIADQLCKAIEDASDDQSRRLLDNQ